MKKVLQTRKRLENDTTGEVFWTEWEDIPMYIGKRGEW
jgi:hypothetical protein